MGGEKRDRWVHVRLTDGECTRLRASADAAGTSASGFSRAAMRAACERSVGTCPPRPRPDGGEGRTARLELRLTPTERALAEERARWMGCGVSEAVRRLALADEGLPPVVVDTESINGLRNEIFREGVNINQFVAYLNTYKGRADEVVALELLEKVKRQVARMDAVLDDLEGRKRDAERRAAGRRRT